MPNTIKVGVLTNADGSHLDSYFPALAAIAEVEGVALADPTGKTVERARKALGDKLKHVFNSHAELVQKYRPEMALVSLESVLSPTAIELALNGNCHVMAEKPACVRASDFERLHRLAVEKHRHLMLALANRLHAPAQEARRLVQKGVIGKIYACQLHIVADQTRLQRESYPKQWVAMKSRAGGGHLAWLGIHWLDLLHYITGLNVEEVAGFAGVVGGAPVDVEDSAAVALKFGNNVYGTMTSGYYLDKGYHSYMHIWGEHGYVKFSAIEGAPLEWYSTREKEPAVQLYKYQAGQRGYTPFVRACVRASANLDPAPITSEDGLRVLKTIFAFYQAVQSGRTQKV